MADKRDRIRENFWLDVNKPDERALADLIDRLKQQKQYAATVRDGIWLVDDLRNGRLDVLFSLFPYVKELFYFAGQGRGVPSASPLPWNETSDDGADLPITITRTSDDEDAADNFLNSLDSLEF